MRTTTHEMTGALTIVRRGGAAAAALAVLSFAGCSSTAPAVETPAAGASANAGAVVQPPAFKPELNVAASSAWIAEERLMPSDPILAMVETGKSVETPTGLSITCNPDNGRMTARLAGQPAERAGQKATFRVRLGEGGGEPLEGSFVANRKTGAADFVFPIEPVRLKMMGQLDTVTFETDAGAAQWAFVRNPAAQPQARFIGSLRDLATQTTTFMYFCNPK